MDYLIAHPEAGQEIRPYFNYIDEWADGWAAVKVYIQQIERERAAKRNN